MQKRFYLDTCIWRDYFEDRKDRFRPLGEWAFRLIKNIIKDGDMIIYSDLIIRELSRNYNEEEIQQILSIVPSELIMKVEESTKDTLKAIELSSRFRMPRNDALHFILAEENQCILITRDKHFNELSGQLRISKPEDLI